MDTADTNDGSCLYRTIPVLVQLYEPDLYDQPSTYRLWLAMGLGGLIETHTLAFAATAPASVITFIVDPADEVGASLWHHFEHRGDPLPTTRDVGDAGRQGPVVVIPCVEFYARRVLHWLAPEIEQRLTPTLGRGRSWLVVAAGGGVALFDARISTAPNEFDEFNDPLRMEYELQYSASVTG